jgi:hypothetical protein
MKLVFVKKWHTKVYPNDDRIVVWIEYWIIRHLNTMKQRRREERERERERERGKCGKIKRQKPVFDI